MFIGKCALCLSCPDMFNYFHLSFCLFIGLDRFIVLPELAS